MNEPVLNKEIVYSMALAFSVVKKAVMSVVPEATNKTDRVIMNSILRAARAHQDEKEDND